MQMAFFPFFAVREGFEPSVQFPVRQFSKLLLSASQSPHRLWGCKINLIYYKTKSILNCR